MQQDIDVLPLQTAGFTCLCRACAAHGIPKGIGVDYLAHNFLPPATRIMLRFPLYRRLAWRNVGPPGTPDFVLARGIVMDTVFAEALDRKIPQLVILGAGFDTRAFRFSPVPKETTVFEVDLHNTQQKKRQALERAGLSIPQHLRIIPIDLNVDSLAEGLETHGFDRTKPTLFLWEGVTPYLPIEAIQRTLDSILNCSAPGSHLVFDYMDTGILKNRSRGYGSTQMAKRLEDALARKERPFLFSLEPHEAEPFIQAQGFQVLKHYRTEDLEKELHRMPGMDGRRISVWMNILLVACDGVTTV